MRCPLQMWLAVIDNQMCAARHVPESVSVAPAVHVLRTRHDAEQGPVHYRPASKGEMGGSMRPHHDSDPSSASVCSTARRIYAHRWVSAVAVVTVCALSACASSNGGGNGSLGSGNTLNISGSGGAAAPEGYIARDVLQADFDSRVDASRDPIHSDMSWVPAYERGAADRDTRRIFAYLRSEHLAYRGSRPKLDAHVQKIVSPTKVVIAACIVSKSESNPWSEYDTRNGHTVPRKTKYSLYPSTSLAVVMKAAGRPTQWFVASIARNKGGECAH